MDYVLERMPRQRFAGIIIAIFTLAASAFFLSGCGGGSSDNGGGCSGGDRYVAVNTYDGSGRYIAEFNFSQYNADTVCSGGSTTVLRIRNRSGYPLCTTYRVEFFDTYGSRRWTYEGRINYLNPNSSTDVGTISTNPYPIDSGTLRVTFLSDPYDSCSSGGGNVMVGSWQGTGRSSGSFNPTIPSRSVNIYMTVSQNGSTNIDVRFLDATGTFETGQMERYSGSTDTGAYFQGSGSAPWGDFTTEGFFDDKGNGRRGIFLSNYYNANHINNQADENINGSIVKTSKSVLDGKNVSDSKAGAVKPVGVTFGGGNSTPKTPEKPLEK